MVPPWVLTIVSSICSAVLLVCAIGLWRTYRAMERNMKQMERIVGKDV